MAKKPPKPSQDDKRLKIDMSFEQAIDRVLGGAGKNAPSREVKPRTKRKPPQKREG